MALTRKPTRRRTTRTKRKPARAAPDTGEMIKRIDAMIRELETMRKQLNEVPSPASEPGLTERLFGAAGHGTWDEYDLDLDWKRFSE